MISWINYIYKCHYHALHNVLLTDGDIFQSASVLISSETLKLNWLIIFLANYVWLSALTISNNMFRNLGGEESWGASELACQCKRFGFNPWVEKIAWRMKWQSSPVFLPVKSHGQRNLAGYSSWGLKRVRHDLATKQQHVQRFYIYIYIYIYETFLLCSLCKKTGEK